MSNPGWIFNKIKGGKKQVFSGYPKSRVQRRRTRKLAMHNTEGRNWPSYPGTLNRPGATAPEFTVNLQLEETRQHFSLSEGGRCLRAGGVAANNVCVSVEVIGYCSGPTPDVTDLTRSENAYLAHVLGVICDEMGIPKVSTVEFKRTGAYGINAPQRLSAREFARYEGILGHQHVPGNSHWDPGTFDIDALLEAMGSAKPVSDSEHVTKPSPPSKTAGSKYKRIKNGSKGSGTRSLQAGLREVFPAYKDSVSVQNGQLIDVDDLFGDQTEAWVKEFQGRSGIAIDGIVYSDTWEALEKHGITPTSHAKAKNKIKSSPKAHRAAKGKLRKGSKGKRVEDLQQGLRDTFPAYAGSVSVGNGKLLGVDKIFGVHTEAWVKEFQERTGLETDGVVGPKTTAELNKHGIKF